MTDQEKLQQLFQAALRAPSAEGKAALVRAFPTPAPIAAAPISKAVPPAEPPGTVAISAIPPTNAGLDHAASAELGALLDDQMARQKRRHRREVIGTFVILLGLTGGGLGWFIQSPSRVQAFREAVADIRSVGDVAAMVAKYQVALDKIAARSKHIDQATEAIGGSPNQVGMEDVNMDAEMHAMMGEEGKTTGERSKMLQNAFGKKFGRPATATTSASDQSTAKSAGSDLSDFN